MSIFSFVKSKLSILDVVQEYAQLKRAGGYWKGSCPFHQETDASFTVSPDKQIFYCFGCHASGDLIAFIEKIENLSPIEATNHLVEKHGLSVPPEVGGKFKSTKRRGERDQFFRACQETALWCCEQLKRSKNARAYLEKRDVKAQEWELFTIGYFPGGVHAINMFLKDMARKSILLKDLLAAGIVAQGRTTIYSPFEERILFPIRTVLGRTCGFGGRVFGVNDTRAKYYNSRESEWFAKGTLLFGVDLAKKEMQRKHTAFLVEGYTDCVAMVKHGYTNTVATLGTACTIDHLKALSRYVKILYVLYDGDGAGQKAILRLTRLCWEANLDLQIVKLPEKEDPASFLERGGDLVKLLENSCDIFAFFVRSLGEQFWGKTLSEKIELCDKIIEVVAKINDSFKQDLLLQQAASVMQIPFESLKLLLARHDKKMASSPKEPYDLRQNEKEEVSREAGDPLEEKIASLVINSVTSQNVLRVEKDLLPYFSEPVKLVLEKIEVFLASKQEEIDRVPAFDELIDFFKVSVERDWVIKQSFAVEDESPEQLFERLLFRFRKKNWKRIVQDIKQQISKAKKENDPDTLRRLLESFLTIKQEMKQRGLL